MATVIEEDNPPVPNWLLKLEEQREKRLKVKLGHEAGAGAPCQICGDKCPGLDLHFWRKICKICKCGKEDHDISDEDIYGFVQFTLLGSKPVKTKGILLKGCKDEVILEFTPKGSSHDVKKYLDELPSDMLPVKGSDAAKLRKQRLQKQMPAHDIDPTLCHALTDEEIKQLEEYVAFIRKHSVGQGSIIRLPQFYKGGTQHILTKPNANLITQSTPNQIATNQPVFLQAADLSNNLQNLSLRDQFYPAQKDNASSYYAQKPINPMQYEQNPTDGIKIKNVVHPLTTTNVERHQEQYENPNYELNNANMTLNYAPQNFINPSEQHQVPTQINQPKDLTYPISNLNPINNANYDPIVNPNFVQYQVRDLEYPVGFPTNTSAAAPPPINEKTHPNFKPSVSNDYNSNSGSSEHILNPLPLQDPIVDSQIPCIGLYVKDKIENPEQTQIFGRNNYTSLGDKDLTHKGQIPVLQAQNLINPIETHQQNLTSVGYLQDINYPMLVNQQQQQQQQPPDSNSNIVTCHECRTVFTDGSVAVSAERTVNLWHAKCFNCHTCKQPLADLLYFYHKETDNIYCGRDYAILKGIPRCAACDELIFVREYCLAEGSTFHVKHFCCFECDQPLAGKSYVMENNQPVCLECYENLKAETCQDCRMVIRPEEQGVCLQELHWHATKHCFVCKKCRKPLLGGKMLLRNENLFCSDYCFKNY